LIEARRLASPAPEREERKGRSIKLEAEVYNTCREWATWHRQRGFYGAPMPLHSVLGQLVRVSGNEAPNARCDARLAAFHLAIIQYPREGKEGIDRLMFEAQFLSQRRHIKALAYELGIGRTTWYERVNSFARRVYQQHKRILAECSEKTEQETTCAAEH
jgi:hypothetical protein